MAGEKEEYTNVFDAASKLGKKKATEASKVPPAVQQKLTDEEMKESFDRCKKLYELIADTIDRALTEKKLSFSALEEYFNTSNNFNDEQWRLIQSEKKKVQQQLKELVAVRERSESKKAEKKETKPKSMQVKSRWISMR